MIDTIVKWLEAKHLNHAAMSLVLYGPMLLIYWFLNYFNMGLGASTSFTLGYGWYIREVTQFERKLGSRRWNPKNWDKHDRIQSYYAWGLLIAIPVGVFLW